ncbi:MAG: NMT1/THI5-like domain-containing protein [Chloroflexi bacterium OLB15]|nr:MAG: NMT1/THI5-like domain-containing protein [Chloroflexi bacterium OLB15]
MKTRLLIVMLAFSLLLSAGASAQSNTPITLFLTFVPNIQFSPVYVGLEKGYFSGNGIDITIEHGDEPVGVNLIAANQRQFGLISGEQIIAARASALPVISIYQWFQSYPVGIVYADGIGIETVNDLAGRAVGVPGRFGATYSGLTAILGANGMTEADINLQEIGFNAPDVICTGGVEAASVYINNEPLQIAQRAAAGDCGDIQSVSVFPVTDYVNMVSNVVMTNEQTIAEQPELVQSFVSAFDQSLRDVINNPAEAYLLSVRFIDNLPLSAEFEEGLQIAAVEQAIFLQEHPEATREEIAQTRADLWASLSDQFAADELTQFEVLLATIDLWDADQIGISDPAAWQATQDVVIQMGFMTAPIDTAEAFTNDFVPNGS